jgi:hypothetical protein
VDNSDGLDVHVFLLIIGEPDDRLALDFVIQICANPRVRMTKSDDAAVGTGKSRKSS